VSSRSERRAFTLASRLASRSDTSFGVVELLRLLLGCKRFSASEFRLDQLVQLLLVVVVVEVPCSAEILIARGKVFRRPAPMQWFTGNPPYSLPSYT